MQKPYTSHLKHRHWGNEVPRSSFIECPGAGCEMCAEWFNQRRSLPSEQTAKCLTCDYEGAAKNVKRHQRTCGKPQQATTLPEFHPAEMTELPTEEQKGQSAEQTASVLPTVIATENHEEDREEHDNDSEESDDDSKEEHGDCHGAQLVLHDQTQKQIEDYQKETEAHEAKLKQQYKEQERVKHHRVGHAKQLQELKELQRERGMIEQKYELMIRDLKRETKLEIQAVRDKAEERVTKVNLDDCTSIQLKLIEMGVRMPKEKLDMFMDRQEKAQAILKPFQLDCNNNQFAAAIAAIHDPQKKRQLLQVPSGMGKSRIIAAVIALKKLFYGWKQFTIVFTTDLLRRVDEQAYTTLAALLQIQLELIVYRPSRTLMGQVKKDTFLVIDEADQILLDHGEALTHPSVLGLSATPYAERQTEEKKHLEEKLKFTLLYSKISGAIQWQTATEKIEAVKFFERAASYAKLIYDVEGHLPSNIKPTEMNCENLGRLKQLTKQDVLLISDPKLARGVDYRAAEGTTGIALLVMSECESERAYVQLLGRVGRYKEPCLRFVWSGLASVVNQVQQAQLIGKLRQHKKTSRGHQKRTTKEEACQSKLVFAKKLQKEEPTQTGAESTTQNYGQE